MRIVAVAEHRDVDRVRRRGVLPDHGINAREVDLLVEPFPDPIVAGIGNKVRKSADAFVVAWLQPIAPDHFHVARLDAICQEPEKEPRRMIVRPPWYQGGWPSGRRSRTFPSNIGRPFQAAPAGRE